MTLASWKRSVPLFRDGYADTILEKIRALRGKTPIFPAHGQVFHAFERTAFNDVNVVILGQDPYHGEGQAHGLAFSVPVGVPAPPSLRNILKEVEADIGPRKNGVLRSTDLSFWADQGVLLMNTILTVESGKALSHKNLGWETLTSEVIVELARQRENLVFMLWGAKAQEHSPSIDPNRHLILAAAHPSPLSAFRGFLGCRHFSKADSYLKKHGSKPVSW
jgi:uracil-DNA glycosylase